MEIFSPFHYLPIADSSADVSTLLSALAKWEGTKAYPPISIALV